MPGIGIRYVLGSLRVSGGVRRSCALHPTDVFEPWFPSSLFQSGLCPPYPWPSLLRIPTRMSHLHGIFNLHCKPPRGRDHIHLSVKPNVHIWQRTNSKKDHRQYVRRGFFLPSWHESVFTPQLFSRILKPYKACAALTRVRWYHSVQAYKVLSSAFLRKKCSGNSIWGWKASWEDWVFCFVLLYIWCGSCSLI